MASFLAGTATVKINPSGPVWLGGYGDRTAPHRGVTSDLFARAIVLRDPAGVSSLVIGIDQLGLNRASVEKIMVELQRRFGFPRERVVLAFSHTHSAPVADRGLEMAYRMTPEDWTRAEAYGDFLRACILEAVDLALRDLVPVRLHFGRNVAGFGVNRRRVQPRFAACPAPVDHDVPVLRITGENGVVKAVLFGYACHNTTLPFYDICGDYSGFACAELGKTFPFATCLFVPGCGADINPLPRHRVELARHYGSILAASVEQVVLRPNLLELDQPIVTAREEVTLGLQAPTADELKVDPASPDWMLRRWAQKFGDDLRDKKPVPLDLPYPVLVWNFGPALAWIILTAEVCVDYSLRLRREHGLDSTWVSAYANELFGYLPSERLLREGGYEGGDSKIVFGLPGPFVSGTEERVAAAVSRCLAASRKPATAAKS